QAEGHGREPLQARLLAGPVVRCSHEGLGRALGGSVEAAERGHELAGGEHLNLQSPAAHLVDDLVEVLGRSVQDVQRRSPGRRHAPLEFRLCYDVLRVDRRHGSGRRPDAAGLVAEYSSLDIYLLYNRYE